ncbi:MAG: hypothetical protein ACYTBZ_24350 [Planctomycetota bacterium]|jgi:hypothetical protein
MAGPEAGTSDIFGVGRVVDEASEVIDSLDRPFLNQYETWTEGKKTIRREWHISKLDVAFALLTLVLGLMAARLLIEVLDEIKESMHRSQLEAKLRAGIPVKGEIVVDRELARAKTDQKAQEILAIVNPLIPAGMQRQAGTGSNENMMSSFILDLINLKK